MLQGNIINSISKGESDMYREEIIIVMVRSRLRHQNVWNVISIYTNVCDFIIINLSKLFFYLQRYEIRISYSLGRV